MMYWKLFLLLLSYPIVVEGVQSFTCNETRASELVQCVHSVWNKTLSEHQSGNIISLANLWDIFNANFSLYSIQGEAKLNSDFFTTMEQLGYAANCSLSYNSVVYAGNGKIMPDGRWQIIIDIMNLSDVNEFELDYLKPVKKYMFQGMCVFSGIHHEKFLTLQTTPKYVQTAAVEEYPSQIRGFYSLAPATLTSNFESTMVTLQWTPLNQWNGEPVGFQAKCLALNVQNCSSCKESFKWCLSCFLIRFHWSKSIKWFVWHVRFLLKSHHTSALQQQRENLHIVCAVRAVSKRNPSGPWSRPVLIDIQHQKPPPRLLVAIVSGQTPLNLLLDTTEFQNKSDEYPILMKKEPDYPSVLEMDCCLSQSYSPRIIDANADHPIATSLESKQVNRVTVDEIYGHTKLRLVTDHCFNWIAMKSYALIKCTNTSKFAACLQETLQAGHDGTIIYKINDNYNQLHHIICNPFYDFIAWTESRIGKNPRIMVSKPVGMRFVSLQAICSDAPSINNVLLSIDWALNGSLIYVGENNTVWSVALSGKCTVLFHGHLAVKSGIVSHITSDWFNIYFVLETKSYNNTINYELFSQQKGENGILQPDRVSKIQYGFLISEENQPLQGYLTGYERIKIGNIVDILAVAPEMRASIYQHWYTPEIVNNSLQVRMVDKETAQLTMQLHWLGPNESLKPPVNYLVNKKKLSHKDEKVKCLMEGCNTMLKGRYFRNQTLTLAFKQGLETYVWYYVEVVVVPLGGHSKFSWKTNRASTRFFSKPPTLYHVIIPSILAPLAVLVGLAVFAVILFRHPRWKLRHLQRLTRKQVQLDSNQILGQGNYGEVYKGLLDGHIKIAVKVLKTKSLSTAEQVDNEKQFLEEAIILGHLKHPNVVKVLGICLDIKPYMLVFEYIAGGNLQSYLRSAESSFDLYSMVDVSKQICSACYYLVEKGYIHRDVSAKNVLLRLTPDKKIKRAILSDFGLAKDRGSAAEPYTTNRPNFPLFHAAPECFHGIFSHATDVFAYGVTLHEIFSHGQTPVKNATSSLMAKGLESADICKPTLCPSGIYTLMLQCWRTDPSERPTFEDISSHLQALEVSKGTVSVAVMPKESLSLSTSSTIPQANSYELQQLSVAGSNSTDDDVLCLRLSTLSSADSGYQTVERHLLSDDSSDYTQMVLQKNPAVVGGAAKHCCSGRKIIITNPILDTATVKNDTFGRNDNDGMLDSAYSTLEIA